MPDYVVTSRHALCLPSGRVVGAGERVSVDDDVAALVRDGLLRAVEPKSSKKEAAS